MPNSHDLTVSLVRVALDASMLEHAAIAHNIANANTPNAPVARVDFRQQMAQIRASLSTGTPVDEALIARSQPVVHWGSPVTPGQGGGIDAEVARMTENTVRYESLLKALDGHFTVLSSAINEGRR